MDNVLLSGRHIRQLVELRRQLMLKFTMKDLSLAHHIRIQIYDIYISLSLITSDEHWSDSACKRLDLI
jgi:hypothetical protein